MTFVEKQPKPNQPPDPMELTQKRGPITAADVVLLGIPPGQTNNGNFGVLWEHQGKHYMAFHSRGHLEASMLVINRLRDSIDYDQVLHNSPRIDVSFDGPDRKFVVEQDCAREKPSQDKIKAVFAAAGQNPDLVSFGGGFKPRDSAYVTGRKIYNPKQY